ncbi:MAG: peptidoglycan-binding protein [Clostridia bacterium]|nr:peptidoglycan-binding protein [Clostridia bacterium]
MGYTPVNLTDVRERIGVLQRMLCFLAGCEKDPRLETYVCGFWNKSTEEAVRAFQEREGLPVTGVCDLSTWDAAVRRCSEGEEKRAPVCLRADVGGAAESGPGDEGDGVLLLQIVLRALAGEYGFLPPPADGCYGAETEGAVTAFQRIAGLDRTGRADRLTWRMLAEAYNCAGSG